MPDRPAARPEAPPVTPPDGCSREMTHEKKRAVRGYLNAKTPVGPVGVHDWAMFDQNVDPSAYGKWFSDAMKSPRASLPWIVIGSPKGGYAGPLPANEAATLDLLKKYGGP